jgi:hypothetical protein
MLTTTEQMHLLCQPALKYTNQLIYMIILFFHVFHYFLHALQVLTGDPKCKIY